MTPDSYFAPLNGQSLLYPGQSEVYRGQCVQSVLMWLKATGTNPPIYASAYQYFTKGIPGYMQVQRGQPILEGDIVVWGSNYPPAGGNGHIDVAVGGTVSSFWAWDSNWVPLKLAKILHNGSDNNYIAGYLRKGGSMGVITTEAVVALSLGTQGTQPQSPDEYAQWVGKSDQQSWDDLITHYSAKGQARQASLEAQIAASGTTLKPGKYIVQ